MKTVENLSELSSYFQQQHNDFYKELAEEALAELKELMKPKSCETYKHYENVNNHSYPCSECNDYYEPKDEA